jgi:hypothetical protein
MLAPDFTNSEGFAMASTWVSEADADTYFSTRLGASTYWSSGAEKEAALTTAQWQIENSDLFAGYPDVSESGVDAVQAQADAVCEQALFLLMDADVDTRVNLQAQGVTQAGIVQETYKEGNMGIAISGRAYACMQKAGYLKYGMGFRYDSPTAQNADDSD